MTEYILDMGYKSYRTTCDVPDLIGKSAGRGSSFIGI